MKINKMIFRFNGCYGYQPNVSVNLLKICSQYGLKENIKLQKPLSE